MVRDYIPKIYSDFVEINTILAIEQNLINISAQELAKLNENQFIITANSEGIGYYEEMLGIIPDTSIESIEFRRQRLVNRYSMTPPFTFAFLKRKLDEIIGIGRWSAYVDYSTYTLYVESSAQNQIWFNEILITMVNIKPANIVFINKPLITSGIAISEQISYNEYIYNYNLGTSWLLGMLPFASYSEKGVIKLPETKSIQKELLSDIANFASVDVTSVVLNDTVTISNFITKTSIENVAIIEYEVTPEQLSEITSIKLLDSIGNSLSISTVFVPVLQTVVIKHNIPIKEGI